MVQEEYRNYWKAKQEDRFKKENLDEVGWMMSN
jgi:hypothetical protein